MSKYEIPELIKNYLSGGFTGEKSAEFFSNILQEYIIPELENREITNFTLIDKFLICFPEEKNPIVKINNEFGFVGEIELFKNSRSIKKGEPIFLSDVSGYKSVETPKYQNKEVPYIFSYFDGLSYRFIVDFSAIMPLTGDKRESPKLLLDYVNFTLINLTLNQFIKNKEIFYNSGLWPIPRLIPSPINQVTHLLIKNEKENAENLLIEYCNSDLFEKITQEWYEIQPFLIRKDIFNEAIEAYKNKKYYTVIYLLIPQIEGLMTDYIYSLNQGSKLKKKRIAKIKLIRDIFKGFDSSSFLDKTRDLYFFDYIVDGPMHKNFEDWFQDLDASIPNRHAIAHGKIMPEFFTEINCVKLIFMIDTIFFIIKNQD